MTRVWYAAKRNHLSIPIPFPIRTLYHFHGPTSQQKGIAKKFNESLQAIPSYVPVNREDSGVTTARSGIALQHFAAGEKVIRQGQLDDEIYIIVAGQAVMSARLETAEEVEMLTLRSGEFFGEMSLFSGEPSTVTIAASNDLEVMKISSKVVNRMIDRQPSFAREIGQILEIRRLAIQETTGAHFQARQGCIPAAPSAWSLGWASQPRLQARKLSSAVNGTWCISSSRSVHGGIACPPQRTS